MLDNLAHPVILTIFGGLLIAGAVEDSLHLRISNRLTLAIVLLYPAYVAASPVPVAWMTAVVLAGAVMLVGFGLFAAGWIGGGDAKLFAAAALWAGGAHFQVFLLATSIFGAGMALTMLARRFWMRRSALAGDAETQPAAPARPDLPYGVAIAFGGLATALLLFSGA